MLSFVRACVRDSPVNETSFGIVWVWFDGHVEGMEAIGPDPVKEGRLAVVEIALERRPPLARPQTVDEFRRYGRRHLDDVTSVDGQRATCRVQQHHTRRFSFNCQTKGAFERERNLHLTAEIELN